MTAARSLGLVGHGTPGAPLLPEVLEGEHAGDRDEDLLQHVVVPAVWWSAKLWKRELKRRNRANLR